MADVEVTAGIFPLRMHGILRQPKPRSEIPVGAHIVERVCIRVACNEGHSMEIPGSQGCLQGVVIRFIEIVEFVYGAQSVREVWAICLLAGAVAGRAQARCWLVDV